MFTHKTNVWAIPIPYELQGGLTTLVKKNKINKKLKKTFVCTF